MSSCFSFDLQGGHLDIPRPVKAVPGKVYPGAGPETLGSGGKEGGGVGHMGRVDVGECGGVLGS